MNAGARARGWYEAWRRNIYMAKTHQDQTDGYQRAAVIANACFVIALVEENADGKNI